MKRDDRAAEATPEDGRRVLRAFEASDVQGLMRVTGAQEGGSVSVDVTFVSGTLLVFHFDTPTGNDPKANGNHVYLWPVSADSVPFTAPAEDDTAVTAKSPAGDQSLTASITSGAYVLGYAVGPEDKANGWSPYVNVVASAYIPAAATKGDTADDHVTTIATSYIGQNTLVFHYAFLDGFNPGDAGAWVGLWKGRVSPYADPPDWFAPVTGSAASGDAALDDLSLGRGKSYTLALFSSGAAARREDLDRKTLASWTVFDGSG